MNINLTCLCFGNQKPHLQYFEEHIVFDIQRFVNPGIAIVPGPDFGNGAFVVRSRQANSHPRHMIRPSINVTYVDVNPKSEHLQSCEGLAVWLLTGG